MSASADWEMNRYCWLLVLKAALGGASVAALLEGRPVVTLGLLALFLLVHARALRYARRRGVRHRTVVWSSFISSIIVLALLGVLLAWERIPVLLGAIFVAASFIKMLFAYQSLSIEGLEPYKPPRSNWALLASVLFLACYILPGYEKLVIVSGVLLVYLVLAVGAFARNVMVRQLASRRRRLAARR